MAPSTSSKGTSSKSTSSKSTSSKSRSLKSTSSKSRSSKSTSSKSTSSKSTSSKSTSSKSTSANKSRDERISSHDSLLNYSSPRNEESFDNHGILSQHMYNTNHRKSEEFACLECGAQFPIVDYKIHSLLHKIKVCEICARIINIKDFTEHQNTHINQDSEGHQPEDHLPEVSKSFSGLSLNGISCPSRNCNMIFTTKLNLMQHLASAHINAIFFICNMCTKTFPSQEILSRHQRIHHNDAPLHKFEKPPFAIACNKKYDELDLFEIEELLKDPRNKMTLFKVPYGTIIK